MMITKYPEITVELVGTNGNAFAVLGAVTSAMRRAGLSQKERDAFLEEAKSGDYDHLLQTCMRWVTID